MNVQVGMYVAARWKDDFWYRARVVKFKTLETVSLFYIDYGSEEDMDWFKVTVEIYLFFFLIFNI